MTKRWFNNPSNIIVLQFSSITLTSGSVVHHFGYRRRKKRLGTSLSSTDAGASDVDWVAAAVVKSFPEFDAQPSLFKTSTKIALSFSSVNMKHEFIRVIHLA